MRHVLIFVCLGLWVGCAADKKGNALFDALDQNKDGVVTIDEYGGDQNSFTAMDADGDGMLTAEELASSGNVEADAASQLLSGDAAGSADVPGPSLIEAGKDSGSPVIEKTPLQKCQDVVTCMTSCVQQCVADDQLCAGQCQTTCQAEYPEGWPLYETLDGCLMQACGAQTDQAAAQLCVMASRASGGSCFQQASACGVQGGSGSCSDIYGCIIACAHEDLQCQNTCKMQGSSTAITDFGAFEDCLNATCGSLPGDQVVDCVKTAQDDGGACAAQTDTCGVGGGTGTVGCRDTLICLYGCPQGDSNCQYQCQQTASKEGLDQLLAWDKCLTEACPGLEGDAMIDCVQAEQRAGGACYAQADTCGLYGTSTCNEIQTCIGTCADMSCVYGCVFGATAEGQGIFTEQQGCFSDNCYQVGQPCSGAGAQTPQCQKCQGDYCPEEIAKCQSHGAATGSAWMKMDNFTPAQKNTSEFYREGSFIYRPLPDVFLPFKRD